MINLIVGILCLAAAYIGYRKEKTLDFLVVWNLVFGILNSCLGVYFLFIK
jgi:hypothetical protein